MPSRRLLALALLGVLVIGAPLLFGGVFQWTILVIAAVALSTLIATIWAERESRPRRTPWVVIAITAAAAWTCVQACPLPCWLVSGLAPDAVSELRAVLSLAGAPPPSWCTLSRDPGATRTEVIKGVAIVSGFLSAWWLAASGERRRVISLVAFSTLAMSAVAHIHMALGLDEVFGVYRPVETGHVLQLAPLMNPNNLGGFAAFGVPVWLGILLRERDIRLRALAALAIVLCTTTALFSLSRGAVAALLGGVSLFAALQLARSRAPRGERASGRWPARLSVAAALSAGIGIGAYVALDRVLREFEQGDTDKLSVIGQTLQFATLHPWLGVGRGAFASAYTARGDSVVFKYAENFFGQWAVDWGFPVAILLALAIAHALVRALGESRSQRRLGAVVGVVCLAASNSFDIGLELLGVAVVAAALLGAAVAPTRTSKRSDPPRRFTMGSVVLASACAAGLAMALLARSVARDSIDDWEAALRSQIEARDRARFSARLQDAVRLHPVEPLFAVLAAQEALEHRDRRALSWINRGMRLAPGWTAPHVQAFRFLWLGGHRDQALLELRAAAEIEPKSVGKYVCSIAHAGSAAVLRAAPLKHRDRRATFLEIAATCAAADVSQELDRVLLSEFPHSPGALEREARRKARQGDLAAAIRQVRAVQEKHPERAAARVLEVQLLLAAKRYEEAAEKALESAHAVPAKQGEALWRMRARALAALKDDAGWAEALGVLRSMASSDSRRLASTYALEGELHRQREQPGAALRSYKAAYRIRYDPAHLRAYAQVATELGDRASTLWAYMELCQREPHKAQYCAKRDALLGQGTQPLNSIGRTRN